MPKRKDPECQEQIKYSEYYNMQDTFDNIYEMASKNLPLTNAVDIIFSKENILLAYHNVKKKIKPNTQGVDKLTIKDIDKLTTDEVVKNIRYYALKSKHGYRPKTVKEKNIPKRTNNLTAMGIPCIWDRLIEQCIMQVLQPYCEAKFSHNSYGFRPANGTGYAICRVYNHINLSHLYYVIEIHLDDILRHVNHSKIMKQIWALGIRDKKLIYILKKILKSQLRLEDGTTIQPKEGIVQCGIMTPLLLNIYLNEFDQWIDSQWANHPIANAHAHINPSVGSINKGNGYEIMKKTHLKEMRIVRYGEEIRIFCRKREDAERILIASKLWIEERLKVSTLEEKTRIINVKEKWMEFLGFQIKATLKAGKWVVDSKMSDESYNQSLSQLKQQIRLMSKPRDGKFLHDEVVKYNQIVMNIQDYFRLATRINLDCMRMQREVMTIFTSRFTNTKNFGRDVNLLMKTGRRKLTDDEKRRYGKSKMIRWLKHEDTPIYPIGYISHKNPSGMPTGACPYSEEGRKKISDDIPLENQYLIKDIRSAKAYGRSIEFMNNKLALFSGQNGRCAVTNQVFVSEKDVHCHHILPKKMGGTDDYNNLVLVFDDVHVLIHATRDDTIKKYLINVGLNKEQLKVLNELRQKAGNEIIPQTFLDV